MNGETIPGASTSSFSNYDLPRRTRQEFELALAWEDEKDEEAIPQLTSHGWRVIDGISLSFDLAPYRDYILGSRGEFTVAKDQTFVFGVDGLVTAALVIELRESRS